MTGRFVLAALAVFLFLRPALADPALPVPLTDADYWPVNMAEVRVGRLLFYDKILSGNRNIACSSCHSPSHATTDGLSLGLGEGAVGTGPGRHAADGVALDQRVPRNAPALFNLGARDVRLLFADGRVAVDRTRRFGLRTPLPDIATRGFASVLAAQAMFPVLSPVEMAGQGGENDVSAAVHGGIITGRDGALDLVAQRVAGNSAYREMFASLHPDLASGRRLAFSDIANALSAFVRYEWRSDQSAFDDHLRGIAKLGPGPAAGMALFYGAAGCAGCHSGPLLTDQSFHAMGQPQLGPGKPGASRVVGRDAGRFLVSGVPADLFAFRTPSLRNVVVTGPWGHAGAFSSLHDFLRQHVDPARGMTGYVPQAVLPPLSGASDDWSVLSSPDERAAIAAAADTGRVVLSEAEMSRLIAFLDSLTDSAALQGRLGVPDEVPSGLAVDR